MRRKQPKYSEAFDRALAKRANDRQVPIQALDGAQEMLEALRLENTELRGQLARALADKPKEVFTAEEVAALQAHQNRHDRHPLTCQCSGSNVLVPTRMGLICPAGCGYIQTWAPNVCLMPPDALADKEASDAP